jgi:hypothetical protein
VAFSRGENKGKILNNVRKLSKTCELFSYMAFSMEPYRNERGYFFIKIGGEVNILRQGSRVVRDDVSVTHRRGM